MRIAAGYNQQEVAYALGVKPPSVCNWESGKTKPSTSNLIKLAALYNVSVDSLVGDADALSPPQQKTAQQELDGQVDDLIKMCAQLTPENLGKAKSYLQYLLEREQPDKPEPPADHQA